MVLDKKFGWVKWPCKSVSVAIVSSVLDIKCPGFYAYICLRLCLRMSLSLCVFPCDIQIWPDKPVSVSSFRAVRQKTPTAFATNIFTKRAHK